MTTEQILTDFAEAVATDVKTISSRITTFTRQTIGGMSALVMVWEDEFGVIRPISNTDSSHIDLISGITLTATAIAGSVEVRRYGPVEDIGWNWVPGRIWLGLNGAITQTPPTSGYDVLIGYAVSPIRIYIDIQEPISI